MWRTGIGSILDCKNPYTAAAMMPPPRGPTLPDIVYFHMLARLRRQLQVIRQKAVCSYIADIVVPEYPVICPLATNNCRPKGTGRVDAAKVHAKSQHVSLVPIDCALTMSSQTQTDKPAHLHPSMGTATRWARSTESPIANGASTWRRNRQDRMPVTGQSCWACKWPHCC